MSSPEVGDLDLPRCQYTALVRPREGERGQTLLLCTAGASAGATVGGQTFVMDLEEGDASIRLRPCRAAQPVRAWRVLSPGLPVATLDEPDTPFPRVLDIAAAVPEADAPIVILEGLAYGGAAPRLEREAMAGTAVPEGGSVVFRPPQGWIAYYPHCPSLTEGNLWAQADGVRIHLDSARIRADLDDKRPSSLSLKRTRSWLDSHGGYLCGMPDGMGRLVIRKLVAYHIGASARDDEFLWFEWVVDPGQSLESPYSRWTLLPTTMGAHFHDLRAKRSRGQRPR
jgi:hypothetical protein